MRTCKNIHREDELSCLERLYEAKEEIACLENILASRYIAFSKRFIG